MSEGLIIKILKLCGDLSPDFIKSGPEKEPEFALSISGNYLEP